MREAEFEAAHALNELDQADQDIGAPALDLLRRNAGEARARARRLRQAWEAANGQ